MQPRKAPSSTPRTCIIVPFRDQYPEQKRAEQLEQFVAHFSAFRIFVIEQTNDGRLFNRGMLLNVGFKIAEEEGYDNYFS